MSLEGVYGIMPKVMQNNKEVSAKRRESNMPEQPAARQASPALQPSLSHTHTVKADRSIIKFNKLWR